MVKQGFFPPSNAPLFFVHYWGPQDRDIRATEEIAKEAEARILEMENVTAVTTFIGQGADRFTLTYAPKSANENYAFFMVRANELENIPAIQSALAGKLTDLDFDASFYTTGVKKALLSIRSLITTTRALLAYHIMTLAKPFSMPVAG